MHKEIKQCRVCRNTKLDPIINLRDQKLTGVFPKTKEEFVPWGPLELVKCKESSSRHCGLVQLKHTFESNIVYGQSYGYRSGLNATIINHLKSKYEYILDLISLDKGDVVVDIGSNDGTLLNFFSDKHVLVGADPLALKFKQYYSKNISIIPEFFSKEIIETYLNGGKAKVITSISMFYDIEEPKEFMQDVAQLLDNNGIWLFEQNYLPSMLKKNAYDTICHEHLGYYGFKQIKWMADRVGLKIIDVGLTNLNGGSFYVTVTKQKSTYKENKIKIQQFLDMENQLQLQRLDIFEAFNRRVSKHKYDLLNFIRNLKSKGKRIVGFGASTKGNVLLQYCGLNDKYLDCIVDVNAEKFGSFTPGSNISIVSEDQLSILDPDYVLVLPWHFKDFILARKNQLFHKGTNIIFPLPRIEIIKDTCAPLEIASHVLH